MSAERVRTIFDREILAMEANMEPSTMVEWLERLRDEVLAELNDGSVSGGAVRGLGSHPEGSGSGSPTDAHNDGKKCPNCGADNPPHLWMCWSCHAALIDGTTDGINKSVAERIDGRADGTD